MGMINVENALGDKTRIPAGALKSYRNLGWFREGEELLPEDVIVEDADAQDDDTNGDKFIETLMLKPLSSWNKNEIKQFAAINAIDLTGTKNAQEAKDIIKVFMASQKA